MAAAAPPGPKGSAAEQSGATVEGQFAEGAQLEKEIRTNLKGLGYGG